MWKKSILFCITKHDRNDNNYSFLFSIFGLHRALIVAVKPSEVALRYNRPNIPRSDKKRVIIFKLFPSTWLLLENTNTYRSAVIAEDMAHTNATMKRI